MINYDVLENQVNPKICVEELTVFSVDSGPELFGSGQMLVLLLFCSFTISASDILLFVICVLW